MPSSCFLLLLAPLSSVHSPDCNDYFHLPVLLYLVPISCIYWTFQGCFGNNLMFTFIFLGLFFIRAMSPSLVFIRAIHLGKEYQNVQKTYMIMLISANSSMGFFYVEVFGGSWLEMYD